MSKHFYIALALIFAAFAVYEATLNFYLRRLHDTAVKACVRVETVSPYIQARAE